MRLLCSSDSITHTLAYMQICMEWHCGTLKDLIHVSPVLSLTAELWSCFYLLLFWHHVTLGIVRPVSQGYMAGCGHRCSIKQLGIRLWVVDVKYDSKKRLRQLCSTELIKQ